MKLLLCLALGLEQVDLKRYRRRLYGCWDGLLVVLQRDLGVGMALVLPVSGDRFQRCHHRFPVVGAADADAAKRLFRKALSDRCHAQRVINTDLAPIYGSAIPDIKKQGTLRRRCRHRPVKYLNNLLEQARRAIQRRQAMVPGTPGCATNDSGLRGDGHNSEGPSAMVERK
jgi:hypothetical protein